MQTAYGYQIIDFTDDKYASKNIQAVTDSTFPNCVSVNASTDWPMTLSADTGATQLAQGQGATVSLWLFREANTALCFGTKTHGLHIAADGSVTLFSGQSSVVTQLTIAAGVWSYIAWASTATYVHTLCIDGQNWRRNEAIDGISPILLLYPSVTGANAKIANSKLYDRVLTDTEILADYHADIPASSHFVAYYPIDFVICSESGIAKGYPDNTLFISDPTVGKKVAQSVHISNASDKTIHLAAIANAPDATHHHFALRFRNGTFITPKTNPNFLDNLPSDWVASTPTQNQEDGSWSVYIASTKDVVFDAGHMLPMPFTYTTADGSLGSRSTRVLLQYGQNITYQKSGMAIAGERQKQIDVLNIAGQRPFPLEIGVLGNDTIVCDGKTDNTIVLYMMNRSEQTISLQSDTANTTAQVTIALPVAGTTDAANNDYALIGSGQKESITYSVSQGEKNISLSDANTVVCTWKPAKDATTFAPKAVVTFTIAGIVSSQKVGGAFIAVDYEYIPGFADGRCVIPIRKTDNNLLAGQGSIGVGIDSPNANIDIQNWVDWNYPALRIGDSKSSSATSKQNNDVRFLTDANGLAIKHQNPNNGNTIFNVRNSKDEYAFSVSEAGVIKDGGNGAIMPEGGIILWSGEANKIPVGWVLCDGSNGTPDLSGRFVVGIGVCVGPGAGADSASYKVGAKGGKETVALTKEELPEHTHTIESHEGHTHWSAKDYYILGKGASLWPKNSALGPGDEYSWNMKENENESGKSFTEKDGSHTHTCGNEGSNVAHENRPPYYALAFIMKQHFSNKS